MQSALVASAMMPDPADRGNVQQSVIRYLETALT